MKSEYRVSLQISTAEQTLKKADIVLSLAATSPEIATTLSACAVVILAASLEQGILAALSSAAANCAAEEGVRISDTPHAPLSRSSLRRKMQEVPKVLTGGRFQLNPGSRHTKALHELITLRNKLVHIDEEALVLNESDPQVSIKDDVVKITVSLPVNPWITITLKKASTYRDAVEIYFREVLSPPAGKIRCGEIVSVVAH